MAAVQLLKLTSLKHATRLCAFRSCHSLSNKYAEALHRLPATKVTELANGLRVATEFADTPFASVGVWINAGSRNEDKSANGSANFFEHLAFKGTKNRSLKDLEHEVMKMGAEMHAITGREETMFYAKCLPDDVPRAVDLLSDVIQNSNLDQNDIEHQRKVILSELESIETDVKQVTFDYLHLTAYQGTPLEKSVYGSSDSIKKITREDIMSYLKQNFRPSQMVLVGTGNVNHDAIVKLAEKHLAGMSAESSKAVTHTCRFTGSDVRSRDDWLPFGHVAIAVDTCGYTDPDIYPLMIAKAYIGSWNRLSSSSANTSNTLVQHVYKGDGCHSFDAFHILYQDTGLWGCYFEVDNMSLDDFVYNLQDEWMKLCVSISDADLIRVKNQLKNQLSFSLEDGSQSLPTVGREVHFHSRRVPLSEVVEKIEAVTLNQLKDTCLKYIYDRCPAVAAVGPVEGLTDYCRIRSGMYWLRY